MSPPPREMISWVLEELAVAGAEGISISTLFDGVVANLASTSDKIVKTTKRDLWKSLVARDDVNILHTKAVTLRGLAYKDVLDLDFGEAKVTIQTLSQSLPPNGDSNPQPAPPTQSATQIIPPAPTIQSLNTTLVSSIGGHTPPPGPIAATPHSETTSTQQTASPTLKHKGRRPKGSAPKPIQRKTSRTWTEKAHHATQEDADREEDVRQYEAGLTRVYIDPPGSERRDHLETSSELESKPKGLKKLKQKVAVFKSLSLTDPLWLIKNRGSWRATYNERKAEMAASPSPEPRMSITKWPSKKVQVGDSQSTKTTSAAPKPSPKKRKAGEAAHADSIDEVGQPPKKRANLQEDVGNSAQSRNTDVATPVPDAVHREQLPPPTQGPTTPLEPFQPDFLTPRSVQLPQANMHLSQAVLESNRLALQRPEQTRDNAFQGDGTQLPHPGPSALPAGTLSLSSGRQVHTGINNELNSVQRPRQADTVQNASYQPRTRASIACEACRLGKKRCDVAPGSTVCYMCVANKLECSLLGSYRPPSPPRHHVPRHTPHILLIPQPPPSTIPKQIQNFGTHPPALISKRIVSQEDIKTVEVAWSIYTAAELRAMCETRSLPLTGMKSILIARLSGAFSTGDVPLSLQYFAPPPTVPQQPGAAPDYDTIMRNAQNGLPAYNSPYSTSDTLGKTSRLTAGDLTASLSESAAETPRIPTKLGRPKKSEKAEATKISTHTHLSTDLMSTDQVLLISSPANANEITPMTSMETEKSDPADSTRSQAQSVDEVIDVTDPPKKIGRAKRAPKGKAAKKTTKSQPGIDPKSPTPQSTPVSTADIPPQSQPGASLQNGSKPTTMDAAETAKAAVEARNQSQPHLVTNNPLIENPSHAGLNLNSMSSLPNAASVDAHRIGPDAQSGAQRAITFQGASQPSQGIVADTGHVSLGQFQSLSPAVHEVSDNVRGSGFGFGHRSLSSENASRVAHPPIPNPPSQSWPQGGVQMPSPQWQHPPDQNYMNPQSLAGEIPHQQYAQQGPLGYSLSTTDGRPNFVFRTPPHYMEHVQGHPYPSVSYGTAPTLESIQQLPQPTFYQPQLHGPPLGYFSPSTQPSFLPRQATTQPASVPNKKRKHDDVSAMAPPKTPQPNQVSAPDKTARIKSNNQSDTAEPYKAKGRMAELEEMESTLARFSAEAEAIELPNITARLFVSYDNVVGNLFLSGDRTQLAFRALDQDSSKEPFLLIETVQVTQNPILSHPKSRPVELRVKYENDSEEETLCRFYIGQTEEAYKAANVMRAAIVTARIVARAAAGQRDTYELFKEDAVANIEVVKPFKCETCNKRFKNKEGIKYHLEKSNATCNPNFVPPAKAPEPITMPKTPSAKSKLKKGSKAAPPKKVRTVSFVEDKDSVIQEEPLLKKAKTGNLARKGNAVNQAGTFLQSVQNDSSDSNSDDSILLWAEKVAFVNPGEIIKSAPITPTKPKPKPRPLPPSEDAVLRDLVHEAINYTAANEAMDTTVETVLRDLTEEVVTFASLQEQLDMQTVTDADIGGKEANSHASLDQVNNQRAKNIIVNLVDRNFGIFPGEKGLWVAFVATWLQDHARSGVLPTSKLCDVTLGQLVQEKKLISTTFSVRENGSMAATRTVITTPSVELNSAPIETLRELIRMAYPGYYVPSRFAPQTAIREKLQGFIDGGAVKSLRKRQDYSKSTPVGEGSLHDSDYEYDFEDDQSVQADQVEDFEDDSDGSFHDDGPRKTKQDERSYRKKRGLRMKTRSGSYASINIESSPETNSMSRTPERDSTQSTSRFGRPKARQRGWKNGPLTMEEKGRRKVVHSNAILHFAPTRLQNTETGAWDQVALQVPPVKVKKKRREFALPEVITYIQSENGAWDTRAFGHGAAPIHVRPQRRADGNPHLKDYIARISKGHRPILWPNPHNRQYLPAAPSKALLNTGTTPLLRKRTKNQDKVEVSPASEDEVTVTKAMRAYKKRKSISVSPEEEEIQSRPKRRRTATSEPRPQPYGLDGEDPDFHTNAKLANVAPRVTRKAMRGGQDLDDIQKLDFFKPRAFADLQKSPNPGLVSLPPSFWVGDKAVDGGRSKPPATAAALKVKPRLEGVENVANWEQGPGRDMLARRTKAAGYGWINHTVDAMENSFDTELMKLKWVDSATFTIETLPYEALDESEDVEIVETPPAKKLRIIQSSKQQKRLPRKKEALRTRRLTAWPTDFDGVVDNLGSIREELDVQLAPKLAPLYGRVLEGTMPDHEENRVLMAVIVVTTLTGGIRENVDWVLVANIFPKYSPHHVRKVWVRMLKNQKLLVQSLTSDFQDAFLSAYEDGKLPKIDYDNLVGYNWGKVVDWAVEKVFKRKRGNMVPLPNSRKEMKKIWDMQEQDSGVDKARETYFDIKAAAYKRTEIISAIGRTVPAQSVPGPKNADDIEIDDVTLARSWIKALVFTPQEDYDIEVAKERMVWLGEELVNAVRKELIDEKVIMHANKGRAVPGRMYEPTDAFFASLRKHHVTEQHFVQAVEFKKFLDAEFASGEKAVRCDYMANEGTIMCVTNLQAHGRIVLKGVGVPMNKMGLTEGGYETRKVPKETFNFKMDICSTDSYLFDEDIPALQIIEFLEPPRGGDAGEIPIWYGVTDNLIPGIWKKVLAALCGVTALRAGASVASLERILRPGLEEWEIWRLMEWGVKVGLIKRVDESLEGWTMGEWWWAVVGRFSDAYEG